MRALRERGMAIAALGVDGENLTGASRLYEGLGFRRHETWITYRKPLGDGQGGTGRMTSDDSRERQHRDRQHHRDRARAFDLPTRTCPRIAEMIGERERPRRHPLVPDGRGLRTSGRPRDASPPLDTGSHRATGSSARVATRGGSARRPIAIIGSRSGSIRFERRRGLGRPAPGVGRGTGARVR